MLCLLSAQAFISDSDDLLAIVSQLQIFFTCFAGLLLKTNVTEDDNYDPDTFGVIMVLMLTSPVISGIVFTLVEVFAPMHESYVPRAPPGARMPTLPPPSAAVRHAMRGLFCALLWPCRQVPRRE